MLTKKTKKITLETIAQTLSGMEKNMVTKTSLAKTLAGLPTKLDLHTAINKAVEDLAIITKKGFDNTVSKNDFKEFKEEMHEFKDEMLGFKGEAKLSFFNIDSKLTTVDERLDVIEKTLGPLVHVSNAVQRELREHNERIARLEKAFELTKTTHS